MAWEARLVRVKRSPLQSVKYFVLERIVHATFRAWMLRIAFLFLLLSWAFLLHVVKSTRLSLIDVTGDLKLDVLDDLVKIGNANMTIRFGVWGFCNGEAELSTIFHTFDFPSVCTPHPFGGKIEFDSKIADILHLGDAARIADQAEALLDTFVKLHPFSVAMGVIAWVMSTFRPRIFKWRTRTVFLLPNPEWAIIPSAIGFFCTMFLTICFHYISLADHSKIKVFKLKLSVFDASAAISLHEGNARKWDTQSMAFFCVATTIYLLCFVGRRVEWLRTLAPRREWVDVPIVQLDRLFPSRRDPESPELAEVYTSPITRVPDPESQALELQEASTFQPVKYEYEEYVVSPAREK
ncbi:hypothetical protein K466DRAFT_597238 [Polyporus arcularius HHB13444]|uniref:Uncharacterized protein n=1 Tax=Polyporus arcularius HHB13444 TaxID=1314778 RepID=A0A5C3PM90_9APHY|nr:hypothetical protein K466DRAFT_597238 [Polyporus arcularius HHB13444]